jgi:hypothetical protein
MEELESQVAKIEIGNTKSVTSYVYILAEKAPTGPTELYIVAELPLFNPAAESACEKICLALGSALKRAYKKGSGENIFETAVAQVNEELGKLAEMGQTHWIDKLNCIMAAKDGSNFSIATCGKVAAYLYRNEEFTDISCSSPTTHPLKTFENVAFGKLKLADILILSTTQLFNHLSIDRLKSILQDNRFLHAAQVIIEILKENAGPEIAFATIFNLQVEPGQTPNEEIDLESYITEEPAGVSILAKALNYVKTTFAMDKTKRIPAVQMPKVSFSDSLKNMRDNSQNFASRGKQLMARLGNGLQSTKQGLSVSRIQGFSKPKKLLFISVIILLLAIILEVTVASHLKNSKQAQSQATTQLKAVQTLLTNAQAALLYKDNSTAQKYILQAQSQLPGPQSIQKNDQALYTQTQSQLDDMRKKLENTINPEIKNLGSLGTGNSLFQFNNFLATQVNSTIISYNKTTNAIEDTALLSSQKIQAAAYIKNTTAVVYNGSALLVWDYAKKQFSQPFISSVPDQNSFVGIKYYPTNSRAYIVNKTTNQIISFAVGNTLSKPVVANKTNANFSNVQDIAIDGSIYVLTSDGITKYLAGNVADFHMPALFTPFSGKGKVATEIGWKNIYILDSGNNRILVLDKQGALVEILKAKEFTNLKDFQVDEASKTMYILNDSSLLKVALP